MADSDSGYKWWIRYVLVPILGGGGVIALVVANINRPIPPQAAAPKTNVVAPQQNTPTPAPVAPRQDAAPTAPAVSAADVEKLVAKWLAAWLSGNADDFVSLASVPFYFDKEVLLTKADLRRKYSDLAAAKGETWKKVEIKAIKVQTAEELQGSGYDLTKDRIFRSMNLSNSDFAVTVQLGLDSRTDGMLIVVRRQGNSLEIVGSWD